MKRIFSKAVASAALLLVLCPAAHAFGPEALLQDTESLLEDADSARNMPVRAADAPESGHHGVARFRGLNKLTAHTETVIIPLGQPTYFAHVEIHLKDCWQAAGNAPFEAKALVELWENRPDFTHSRPAADGSASVIARRKLFHGWMIASQPALSGFEHPLYELRLLGCGNRSGGAG